MDMRKEFPSQAHNRRQWILDTVRENQAQVQRLFYWIDVENWGFARKQLGDMHKMDRDALLLPNGILTDEQIVLLKDQPGSD